MVINSRVRGKKLMDAKKKKIRNKLNGEKEIITKSRKSKTVTRLTCCILRQCLPTGVPRRLWVPHENSKVPQRV